MFADILKTTAAAACACTGFALSPHAAYGLAQITAPASELVEAYDLPRNLLQDAAFAQGMAVGMVDYEREALPKKKELFAKLFASLKDIPEPVVVEVGMGSFPNALYYKKSKGLDIIGVDPNDRMEGFARDSASRAGLLKGDNLRIVHGVSEALPLADNSADAVVCTLTLCSVVDPARSVAEIKRVLKPGGKFLFWEHVLSQTDPTLAQRQMELTPNQVRRADGCHLDRKTGDVIRAAGFQTLDLEYLELTEFSFLNPTVCGIATA
jgi:ubiquinone/menaquinone biosynthesis C-methylase UbiE